MAFLSGKPLNMITLFNHSQSRLVPVVASAVLFLASCTTVDPVAITSQPTATVATPDAQETQAAGPLLDHLGLTTVGAGPDVVLIHGLASSKAVWDQTVAQLTSNYRVHVVQIAGMAGAETLANDEGQVVASVAEELATVLASLDAPAYVIGHSLGGVVALKLAAAQPDKVAEVMIVDALPFFSLMLDPDATADSIAPMAVASSAMMQAQTDDVFRSTQAQALAALVKDEEARATALTWSLASDRSVLARAMAEVMTTDLRPILPQLSVPVTVLYATDAEMPIGPEQVTELYQRAYAGTKELTLVQVENSLHFIMYDASF